MDSISAFDRIINRGNILVAGHRGMKKLFPENTLTGMQKALESGIDMIETDLNLTKDKEVVVMHDNLVDRTTNGTGYIHDYTLEELKKLDCGSWFSPEFAGEQVPTLREFCELIKPWPQLLLNVEIKEKTHETVDLAFAILAEYGLMERCVFTCFDAGIVDYMATQYKVKIQGFPKEYMQNFREGSNGTYSQLYAVGIAMEAFAENPTMPLLTPELAQQFREMGLQVWGFCPDNEGMVREALRCGVTLMTCNDPYPALGIVRKKL